MDSRSDDVAREQAEGLNCAADALERDGVLDRDVPMNVAELVGILASYPPDLPVLVDGYEDGLERPRPRRTYARPMDPARRADYYGPWEEEATPRDARPVLVIGRYT